MPKDKAKLPPVETFPSDAAYQTSVADRVARLNVRLKRQLGTFARDNFKLTIVETRLVILLGMFAPSTVNDLAARSDIDRTQISRSISVLAREKIAHKATSPNDRREAVVTLTPHGLSVHDEILAELYKRNQELIRDIPDEALANFFDIMELLIERAET